MVHGTPISRRHGEQNRLRRRGIWLVVLQRDARRLRCARVRLPPIHQSTLPLAACARRDSPWIAPRWRVFLQVCSCLLRAAAHPTIVFSVRKLSDLQFEFFASVECFRVSKRCTQVGYAISYPGHSLEPRRRNQRIVALSFVAVGQSLLQFFNIVCREPWQHDERLAEYNLQPRNRVFQLVLN